MFVNFTARYTKRIKAGYTAKPFGCSEVVTEGKDLDDCRAMLRDALHEMILAYRQQGKETPPGKRPHRQQLPIDLNDVPLKLIGLQPPRRSI